MKKSTLAVLGAIGGTAYAGFNLASTALTQLVLQRTTAQKQAGIKHAKQCNTELENFWYHKQTKVEWQIQSFDGLNLSATFIPNPKPQNRLIILAHGVRSAREQMIPYAKLFQEMGFDVLMPDARAYGTSEGHLMGYGWLDRFDYQRWLAVAVDQLGDDIQIVLMGLSMGAATVMATSGEPLPGNVRGVIEDSGYLNLYQEAKDFVHLRYHMPVGPLLSEVNRRMRPAVGYTFSEADVYGQVAKGGYPLLIIHGAKDATVPVRNAQELYKRLPQQKMLYIDPDAGHVDALRQHPNHYREAVQDFLQTILD